MAGDSDAGDGAKGCAVIFVVLLVLAAVTWTVPLLVAAGALGAIYMKRDRLSSVGGIAKFAIVAGVVTVAIGGAVGEFYWIQWRNGTSDDDTYYGGDDQYSGSGMPDVVCMNLQDAQDLIQERTDVFYSDSFDATGQGRMQVLDSNWIVVSQVPRPGAPIGEWDANLGAVKYGEPNDC